MIYKEFREDGFPLCPSCGEDELYTLGKIPDDTDYANLYIRCYVCNFDSLIASLNESGLTNFVKWV